MSYTLVLVPMGFEDSQGRLAEILNPDAVVIVVRNHLPAPHEVLAAATKTKKRTIVFSASSKHNPKAPAYSKGYLSYAREVFAVVDGVLETVKETQ